MLPGNGMYLLPVVMYLHVMGCVVVCNVLVVLSLDHLTSRAYGDIMS